MATEAQTTTTQATTVEAEGVGTTEKVAPAPKAETAPKAEPKVEAKVEAKTEKVVADTKSEAKAPKVLADDDDDLPDNDDLISMTPRALKSRITRATKKELTARFGSADFDEIKSKLDRLSDLENKEEERRRLELSEKERLEEDLRAVRAEKDALKAEYETAENKRLVEAESRKIVDIVSKYVDPDFTKEAMAKLKDEMNENWTEADFANEAKSYKKIDLFFKDLVEKKPKLSKDFQEVKELKTTPITNGNPITRPDSRVHGKSGSAPVKSVKDMSKQELAEYKRSMGYNY